MPYTGPIDNKGTSEKYYVASPTEQKGYTLTLDQNISAGETFQDYQVDNTEMFVTAYSDDCYLRLGGRYIIGGSFTHNYLNVEWTLGEESGSYYIPATPNTSATLFPLIAQIYFTWNDYDEPLEVPVKFLVYSSETPGESGGVGVGTCGYYFEDNLKVYPPAWYNLAVNDHREGASGNVAFNSHLRGDEIFRNAELCYKYSNETTYHTRTPMVMSGNTNKNPTQILTSISGLDPYRTIEYYWRVQGANRPYPNIYLETPVQILKRRVRYELNHDSEVQQSTAQDVFDIAKEVIETRSDMFSVNGFYPDEQTTPSLSGERNILPLPDSTFIVNQNQIVREEQGQIVSTLKNINPDLISERYLQEMGIDDIIKAWSDSVVGAHDAEIQKDNDDQYLVEEYLNILYENNTPSGGDSEGTNGCKATCLGLCTGGCYTSCSTECGSGCFSSCNQSCGGACKVLCGSDCSQICQINCENTCGSNCTGSCHSECGNTCGDSCSGGCSADCTSGCKGTCNSYCFNSCKTGCTGSCSGSCKSDCAGTCSTNCSSCTGTCYSSCSTNCYGGCSGGCASCTGCTTGCSSNCGSACNGACDNNCSNVCVTSCNAACYHNCSSHCDSRCTECGGACTSSCKTTCNNYCVTKCINTCKYNCDSTCQAKCAVDCTGACAGTCSNSCDMSCHTNCTGQCTGFCTTTCSNTCGSNCNNKCRTQCNGGCQGACGGGCKGDCKNGCGNGCSSNCYSNCSKACSSTCINTCGSACVSNCGSGCSGGCKISCKSDCTSSCMSGCNVGCTGGCTGSCTTSCGAQCTGCGNNCAGSCLNSCDGSCQLSCIETCVQSCMNSCNVSCTSTCTVGCIGSCSNACFGCTGNNFIVLATNSSTNFEDWIYDKG